MAKKSLLFQFTQAQLNAYIKDENSCVKCVPSKMHIGFPPYGLDNFKDSLLSIISKRKIGTYDSDSRGIVLDVRNIKLEGTMSMIRYDSPELHLNIHAKFYVFQPHVGALLKGTVKHISKRHVSVLIYNVFNVSIRLNGDFVKKLQINKEIQFRVKKFDLQNVPPYIEGELVVGSDSDNADSGISGAGDSKKNTKKVFNNDSSSSSDSEDEKVFKSLVVKTEPTPKPSSSSSSDSDSDDDDAPALPVKQEVVKKEKPVPKAAPVNESSSSDDSSDEEPPSIPKPIVVKSKKKTPEVARNKKDDSSSEDSDSEEETKIPPSQFHSSRVKQEKSSSESSSSDSDEEDFKVPLPKVVQVGNEIVIKRETTPTQRIKRESTSSTDGEPTRKEVNNVRKKVLHTPEEESPQPSFPSANAKTPAVKEEKESPAKKKKNNKSTATESEAMKESTVVKKENGKKLRVSFAADLNGSMKKDTASPSKKSKPSAPAKDPSSSSSSDSEDDDVQFTGSVNLNKSIQDIISQVSKSNTPDKEKSPPKKNRKRTASTADSGDHPSEKKKKTPTKKSTKSEADLSKIIFDSDILSSTRLDSASPLPKPKKKKTPAK